MIAIWVAAGGLSALAAGLILLRAAAAAANVGSEDPTIAVYRRQLTEIDDLAARELLAPAERQAAHAEAGRRLLGAADRPDQAWHAPRSDRKWALAGASLAAVVALVAYLMVGSPGSGDQPLKARVAAWRGADLASLTAPQMAAVLRQATALRPDAEGFRFLAVAESQSGNPANAARALRRAIELAPGRGVLWEMLGISLVDEAGGDETPAAIKAFQRALQLEPKLVLARFHLARVLAQGGDRAGAVAALKALQADLPVDDPRRAELSQTIAEASGPPPAESPVAAGQSQMIAGMVAGLAARLARQPDDPEGWVKLVRSYAVLGDAAARDSALAEASGRFRGRKDIVDQLNAAAKTAAMP
jgi:cytochrome c-type biogenesis protein CcmH